MNYLFMLFFNLFIACHTKLAPLQQFFGLRHLELGCRDRGLRAQGSTVSYKVAMSESQWSVVSEGREAANVTVPLEGQGPTALAAQQTTVKRQIQDVLLKILDGRVAPGILTLTEEDVKAHFLKLGINCFSLLSEF